MALKKPHSDWRLDEISPVDVRAVGLDAMLANLWLRVLFGNRRLVSRTGTRKIADLANEMERSTNPHFDGFEDEPGSAEAWLRADLVKAVREKRWKDRAEMLTVGRPVHALATRIRGSDKQVDDSFTSLLVYAWLDRVDAALLRDLREFLDVDPTQDSLDLASFALALLGSEQEESVTRSDEPAPLPSPACLGQAKMYADDLRRLLAYQSTMPRSALVDHIRRLTGFHVGLYLLRVFRIAVEAEQGRAERACRACPDRVPRKAGCPYRLQLLVDCGEDAKSPVAKLAEISWGVQEDHLARYVRSHIALKKLHQFADSLARDGSDDAVPHRTLPEIAAVEHSVPKVLIDLYFNNRIDDLIEGSSKADIKERFQNLRDEYRDAGLSPFRVYVALIVNDSERRWFTYHRYLLDSLLGKNSSEGLLKQPLGGPRHRRGSLGASLLETLTLIAVVDGEPGSFFTRPLRVDELIGRLEGRYDILIGSAPAGMEEDFDVTQILALNVERFKARLRETGLFTDLSDAFLAQLVRPRHVIS